jgi:hypothetical protein
MKKLITLWFLAVSAVAFAGGPAIMQVDVTGISSTVTASVTGTILASATGKVAVGVVDTIATITGKIPVSTVDTVSNVATITGKVPVSTVDNVATITGVVPVNPLADSSAATTILNTSTVAADITPLSGRSYITIQNISTETVWVRETSVASASFSNAAHLLYSGDCITFPFDDSIPVGHVSSTPGIIAVTQGVRR